ncbi:hypothetical protein [Mycoplasmopsis caviae]|nr:hypothetical protein [Mycoplasmopsis caviae]
MKLYEIEAFVSDSKRECKDSPRRNFLINADVNIMDFALIAASSFRLNFIGDKLLFLVKRTYEDAWRAFDKPYRTKNEIKEFKRSWKNKEKWLTYEYEPRYIWGWKRDNKRSPKKSLEHVLPNIKDHIFLIYDQYEGDYIELNLIVNNIYEDQEISKDDLILDKYYFKVLEAKYYGFLDTYEYCFIPTSKNWDGELPIFEPILYKWPSNEDLKVWNNLGKLSDDEFFELTKEMAQSAKNVFWTSNSLNIPEKYSELNKERENKELYTDINVENFDYKDANIDELNEKTVIWAIKSKESFFQDYFIGDQLKTN